MGRTSRPSVKISRVESGSSRQRLVSIRGGSIHVTLISSFGGGTALQRGSLDPESVADIRLMLLHSEQSR